MKWVQLLQLMLSFFQVGLFSVGGGYAAMPFIQAQVVDKHHWISMKEFTDLISIAEMTPGPIAVNSATFVGIHLGGIPAAVLATLSCIFPSLIIVSCLAYFYRRYRKLSAVQMVLQTLRPVIIALILSAGLSILRLVLRLSPGVRPEEIGWQGAALFLLAFFILRKKKKNPIAVMALCGLLNLLLFFIKRGIF